MPGTAHVLSQIEYEAVISACSRKNGNKEVLRRKSSASFRAVPRFVVKNTWPWLTWESRKRDVPTATSRVGALVGAHLAVSDRHESVPDRVGEK